MKEFYTLNDLAMITSLTTRTLRNHLRQGTLSGEKIDGIWTFTDEQIQDFLALPAVRQSVEARRNAPVFDFLADNHKRANRACVILDYVTDDREAMALSRFYCDCANRASDIELRIGNTPGHTRVILSGGEDTVMDILEAYYRRSESNSESDMPQ